MECILTHYEIVTIVDSKDGYGVGISCYKTHCCACVVVWSGYGRGVDLPYIVMIKHTVVAWNTYKLWTIYLRDTLRENITA